MMLCIMILNSIFCFFGTLVNHREKHYVFAFMWSLPLIGSLVGVGMEVWKLIK